MATARLTGLFGYPVKGMRGVTLDTATVEPCGLAGDRRWLVIDERGQFLTQRQVARLACFDALSAQARLTLRFGAERIEIGAPDASAEPVEVTVWRDRVAAVLAGSEADRWLSRHLERPCRLAYLRDPHARAIDPAYTTQSAPVSFADSFPMLLTSTGSLSALNQALARPIGMDRFRPNLVVEGPPAWAEDGWQRLRIGTITFRAPKPCTRCVVITIDQGSGAIIEPGEPLRTLGRLNRTPAGIVFGCNLIPEAGGTLRLGDDVQVLE